MWSSHSFRIASWNTSAEWLIRPSSLDCPRFALVVPPLAPVTVARPTANSKHRTAVAAKVVRRDFRVLLIVTLLIVSLLRSVAGDQRRPRHRAGPQWATPTPSRPWESVN